MAKILLNIHWLIILYAGWTYFSLVEEKMSVLKESQDRVPISKAKIKKFIKQKNQLKVFFKDIEEAKKKIELVAVQVEKLQRQLPNSISDAANLSAIKDIADGLNIKNVFLAPGIEENKGFYFTKRYKFTGTGTYLQFLIFLEKIAANDRLLNVKTISIVRAAKKQRGRFQISNCEAEIEAYRYNAEYKESRGIDDIEKEFKKKKKKKRKRRKKKKKKK